MSRKSTEQGAIICDFLVLGDLGYRDAPKVDL